MKLSKKYSNLPISSIVHIHEMKKDLEDVVSFDRGDVNLPTNEKIKAGIQEALCEDFTRYMPSTGITELKVAIQNKISRENNINSTLDEILVTSGGTGGLFVSMQACLEAGDEVLIPDPYWTSYPMLLRTAEAKPVSVTFEEDFKLTQNQILENINQKTQGIIINTPQNPLGLVYSKAELKMVADIAKDHDLWVFSDEPYEHLIYDDKKHISIASLDEMKERTITCFSLSKSYSIPGMRVGYIVGPEKVIDLATKAGMYSTYGINSLAQRGAVNALSLDNEYLDEQLDRYKKRKDLLLEGLDQIDILDYTNPEGTFYVFAKIKNDMTSLEFSEYLLEKERVATVPGDTFGKFGEGYVRFSYSCVKEKEIREGINRMKKAEESL